MASKTYYQILEIGCDASPGELRAAYRRLVRKYHPDLNPGDPLAEARTREINEAYAVLSDEVRHAAYDRQLATEWARQVRVSAWPAASSYAWGGVRVSGGAWVTPGPTVRWGAGASLFPDVLAEWAASRVGMAADLWLLLRLLGELNE